MARLFTSGFELNTLTDGVELFRGAAQSGTIVTSPVNGNGFGGVYAYKNAPSNSIQNCAFMHGSAGKTACYRFYYNYVTQPSNAALFFTVLAADLTTIMARIRGAGAAYRTSTAGGGTSGTGNRSGAAITPVVNDLFLVFCNVSGNTNSAPTCSDNNSGTYTLIGTALKNSSADTLSVFVRDALLPNTTSTTVTVATGSNTAGEIVTVAISGMSVAGAAAIRQSIFQANQAAGTTPAPVLASAALANDMTLTACANSTAGGGVVVQPSGWTERQDVSQSTPTTGLEVNTRDSGFTGTTITFGGTSATAFASVAVELAGPVGTLKATNSADVQVGSTFSLPNANTWYRMEVKVFSDASTGTIDVLVDGVSVISVTGQNTQGSNIGGIQFGSGVALTHEYYIDDVACNDTTGSFQTGYPGSGYVVATRPDGIGTGGGANWTRGGADSGTDWGQIDEVAPNDATDFLSAAGGSNASDYFTMSSIPSGLNSVNVVSVGIRYNNDVGDVSVNFQLELYDQDANFIAASAALIAGSTTWRTNGQSAVAFNPYAITVYQDASSNPITASVNDWQTRIDNILAGTHNIQVTAIWLMADCVLGGGLSAVGSDASSGGGIGTSAIGSAG